MHDALKTLAQQHQQLVNAAAEGHISADEATQTVRQLQVVDGAGAVWQVDPETGNFLRAEVPGLDPTPAEPHHFVPPGDPTALAPGFTSPPAQGFGNTHGSLQTPPAFASAPQTPTGDQPPVFIAPPQQDLTPPQIPGNPFDNQLPAPQTSAGRSLFADEQKVSRPRRSFLAQILTKAQQNKAFVILLAVAVIMIGAYQIGGPSEPANKIPNNTPTASPGADNTPDEGTYDTELPPAAIEDTPEAPASPSEAEFNAAVATLRNADLSKIAELVDPEASPEEAAQAAAFYSGLEAAGLTVTIQPLTNNRAQWKVTTSDDVTVLDTETTWKQGKDGTWKLAELPLP